MRTIPALLVGLLYLTALGCTGPRYMRIRTVTASSADGTITISNQFAEKLDEVPPEWQNDSMPFTFPIDRSTAPKGERAGQ